MQGLELLGLSCGYVNEWYTGIAAYSLLKPWLPGASACMKV